MADVHTVETRSKNMRAIKSKDTKPEILIRKALHARGFRFRLHRKNLPGNPDIILPMYSVVIFINGCFWHGHRCHLSKTPKTRSTFWLTKISDNMSRDAISYNELSRMEWRVVIIWECAIKGRTKQNFDSLMKRLECWIKEDKSKGLELAGKS